MTFFLRGLILGFSIAAPVGPIGVLCIRRTLAEGRVVGFVSGLGAATADAIYGSVAAFGLTAIAMWLTGGQSWLRLAGGLFLCYLGIRTWRAVPVAGSSPSGSRGLLESYVSTLLLTLTNPMTILSFAAIFAALGITTSARYASAVALVAGVFCGSALWWLILSAVAGAFHRTLSTTELRWVNRLSGAIIAGFGALALLTAR